MYWWLCLGLWTTQKPIKRHAFQTGEVQRFLANCVPPFPVLLFSLSPPPLSIHVYSFESFLFTSVSSAITVPRFVTFDKRKFLVARVRPESLLSARFKRIKGVLHFPRSKQRMLSTHRPPDFDISTQILSINNNSYSSKFQIARKETLTGDRERRYMCACRERVCILTRRRGGGGGGGGCGTNGGAASGGDFPSFRGFGGCPPRHFRYLIILYLLDHGCDRRCANRRLGRWQDGSRSGPRVMMVFPPRVVILLGLDCGNHPQFYQSIYLDRSLSSKSRRGKRFGGTRL